MKTSNNLSKKFLGSVIIGMLGLLSVSTARAQIFVANTSSPFSVEEYNTDGSLVNGTFIPDAFQAYSLEIGGGFLYVANKNQPLSKYQLDGTLVTNSAIGGDFAFDLAITATNLYVTSYGSTVAEYTTSGSLITASFITGLSQASGIAVSGTDLFVANASIGTIEKYDATTGTAIGAPFTTITGLSSPFGIKILGNDLFVLNQTGSVGEYDATTGAAINTALITGISGAANMAVTDTDIYVTSYGLANGVFDYSIAGVYKSTIQSGGNPYGIAALAQAVPEPSSWAMFLCGVGVLVFGHLRTRRIRL